MRLDKFLIFKKIVNSRSKAVDLIKQGKVEVNGKIVTKQSYDVKDNDKVKVTEKYRYVSRGGYKISSFFKKIKLEITGKKILDVGCSTGGFTDFFLNKKAKEVVAIDVAKGIFNRELLETGRVRLIEELDATKEEELKDKLKEEKFDIISIDVSRVPLIKILKNVKKYLLKEGRIIALFKPQYEGLKSNYTEEEIKEKTREFEKEAEELGLEIEKKEFSELKGGSKGKGTRELFYLIKKT